MNKCTANHNDEEPSSRFMPLTDRNAADDRSDQTIRRPLGDEARP